MMQAMPPKKFLVVNVTDRAMTMAIGRCYNGGQWPSNSSNSTNYSGDRPKVNAKSAGN